MASYLDAVKWKWNGLKAAVMLRGKKENNLWMVKRPLKYVKQAEESCKLKITLLTEEDNEYFPNLRHPSGCSLQYIAMLSHILGGKWQTKFTNPYSEFVPEGGENEIVATLTNLKRKVHNVRN